MRALPYLCIAMVLLSARVVLPSSKSSPAAAYMPTIPAGYVGSVLLHVPYGREPGQVGADCGAACGSGAGDGESSSPMSVRGVRVVGDDVTLIDELHNTVKRFRAPGRLLWQSAPFDNLMEITVDPQGHTYVFCACGPGLRCLDNDGRVAWQMTWNTIHDYLTATSSAINWQCIGGISWTPRGLAVRVMSLTSGEVLQPWLLFLSAKGQPGLLSPGRLVGPDGTIYERQPTNRWEESRAAGLGVVSPDGTIQRRVHPDFLAESGRYAAGTRGFEDCGMDPEGFAFCSSAALRAGIKLNGRMHAQQEIVLWRFHPDGRFREQWRLPLEDNFGHTADPDLTVGLDGRVYFLQFGETGIDVIRYCRQSSRKVSAAVAK